MHLEGTSVLRGMGVISQKVELDSFLCTRSCVKFIVHGHADKSTFCWTKGLNATITSPLA